MHLRNWTQLFHCSTEQNEHKAKIEETNRIDLQRPKKWQISTPLLPEILQRKRRIDNIHAAADKKVSRSIAAHQGLALVWDWRGRRRNDAAKLSAYEGYDAGLWEWVESKPLQSTSRCLHWKVAGSPAKDAIRDENGGVQEEDGPAN